MFAVKSKNDTSIEVVKALLETEVIDLTQKNRVCIMQTSIVMCIFSVSHMVLFLYAEGAECLSHCCT